ncbi:hypothetical protein Tco_0058825 [Tanacetum coccineum]
MKIMICTMSLVLYDRVHESLLNSQQDERLERIVGTRRGRYSTSSSFAFGQPLSSHLNDDDDDGNGEGTSCGSTSSPIRYVNSLTNQVPQDFQNPPNIDPHLEPFYTRSAENQKPHPPIKPHQATSFSFQSKLQISPPSLNEPTSPHLLNPLLDNISDVPHRPLNPQPLQSHSSLDITLYPHMHKLDLAISEVLMIEVGLDDGDKLARSILDVVAMRKWRFNGFVIRHFRAESWAQISRVEKI